MSDPTTFSDLLPGPWPVSPFPWPRCQPAPAPPQAAPPVPDWHQVISASLHLPYFNILSYFTQCYGVLPWGRAFKLDGEASRTQLLADLAIRFDLTRVAVAHVDFFEQANQPAQYPHTALVLAPHLMLELGNEGLFSLGKRIDATLYYSAATDPALLQELMQLLHTHLPATPPAEKAIHVLQLNERSRAEFTPVAFQPIPCDLATHYNDDLLPTHETIVRRLATDHSKGLVLLHGPPGTGKTTYLRHLAGQLAGKRKLFVPPHLASRLTNPDFMSLLTDNKNALLIIEDAERLLLRRDQTDDNAGAISSLLNLTDGFMADVLHIQIICTFNTDLTLLNPALLRPGRLIASYYFGPLALPKTQALAAATGWPSAPTAPLTLAEIFNPDEPNVVAAPVPGSIGFGR